MTSDTSLPSVRTRASVSESGRGRGDDCSDHPLVRKLYRLMLRRIERNGLMPDCSDAGNKAITVDILLSVTCSHLTSSYSGPDGLVTGGILDYKDWREDLPRFLDVPSTLVQKRKK